MPPNEKTLLHFSTTQVAVGTLLVGLKAAHKGRQRVGQRHVDEVFEAVRKAEFPDRPSLFSSLWATDVFDSSIPRKAFEEGAHKGWLYEIQPVEKPCEVEPHWEILGCRAVTQSGLAGRELQAYLEEMGRRFWGPELVDRGVRDFLCPTGAVVVRLIREVTPQDVSNG